MSDAELTWMYSRPQLEAARARVTGLSVVKEFIRTPAGEALDAVAREFGLLAVAYEELLRQWEAGAAK